MDNGTTCPKLYLDENSLLLSTEGSKIRVYQVMIALTYLM